MYLHVFTVAMLMEVVICLDSKIDHIDFDKMLTDDDYLMMYFDCVIDKAPCTAPYAADLKANIEEIFQEACQNCTEYQKSYIGKLARRAYEVDPHKAVEFNQKYDPDSKFADTFLDFMNDN